MISKLLLSGALACAIAASATAATESTAPSLEGTLVAVSPKLSQAWLIDLKTQKIFKTLPTGTGPHEAVVSPDGKIAAVADYQGDGPTDPGHTLTIIDLPSAAVSKTIELKPHTKPHGLVWLDNERLLCTSEASRRRFWL